MTRASALQIHHAGCEVNFLRLEKLLPGFAAGQSGCIGIHCAAGRDETLELCVVERAPYTAELELRQHHPVWGARGMRLRLRVYLDARMAEVVGCTGVRRLLPRYPYPNRLGLARDEKWQLDRLVGEWLERCMAEGRALVPLTVAIPPRARLA